MRDHGSPRPAGGGGGREETMASQARWGPAWGGKVGKRPWVSQARWGDRVMVADTMVISSRRCHGSPIYGGGGAEAVTMGFLHREGGSKGRH